MKNPWIILGVGTILLFGGAIFFSQQANQQSNEGVEVIEHIKGNPNATVELVEYSDFQCPACGAFQPVLSSIMEQYGEQIQFEYKHFPLPIHSHAQTAALAAEAAAQQGKFFEFHDVLFERQSEWAAAAVPTTLFVQYADELSLDVDQFSRQMKSSILRDRVKAEFDEGRELGITGTPTFFLNGQRMSNYETFEQFVAQIVSVVDPAAVASSTEAQSGQMNGQGSGVRFGI